MTLHLSKLILDFARAGLFSRGRLALLVSVLTLANSATTYWAHRPGLSHRQTLRSVLAPIHAHCPEALIMEGWLQGQVSMLHLKHQCPRTKMLWVGAIYDPSDYLAKIRELEAQAPAGTLLVSGFNSYVHYRPVGQGIRLDPFPGALSSNWKLLHELPPPVFETEGEKVRIWRLDKPKP